MKRIAKTAVLALALLPVCFAAQAASSKIFVASTGSDSNDGGRLTPKRSFQAAHDAVAAGGEIVVLDTAGYGALTITKSVGIVVPPGVNGIVTSSGDGITINAQYSDTVVLRGLLIEGAPGGNGNGIVFNSGAQLEVFDCVLQNFSGGYRFGNGILIQPTVGGPRISIVNTTVANNTFTGILYYPAGAESDAQVSIDHVTAANNQTGIALDKSSTGGGSVKGAITNSVAINNSSTGIYASFATATIDHIVADHNGGEGIYAETATVTVGHSLSANNGKHGLFNDNGFIYSYGDNRLEGNVQGPTGGTITPTSSF